jgi:cell wall assembly regulator SMI1
MRDLWRRIEAYLKKHAPAALECLNPPATQKQIRDAQYELGVQFPDDFIASLLIHNGQLEETDQPPHPIAFIPQEYQQGGIYRATWGESSPVSLIVESTKQNRKIVESMASDGIEFDGPIRRDGKWSWIVFVDSGSGDRLGLDLTPAKQGQIGQVISIIHDPTCLLVLAPSYRDWFETLVTRFESGRCIFVEVEGELEAIDRFQSKIDGKTETDEEPGSGDILRFPQ